MSALSPGGAARERFLGARGALRNADGTSGTEADAEDFEPAYLGWEIARSTQGLSPDERRAIASLAAACVVAVRAGSTRLPLDEVRLTAALAPLHAADAVPLLRSIFARARLADPADPVVTVIGRAGDRKPLVLDGDWLYPERMRALEERFCTRVRNRLARAVPTRDARSLGRALNAIAAGPPQLTDEQKRAVREALGAPLALITGGPGTGKTTIVVALLRALAWIGEPMDSIAIAAPTGKAAQRLRDAIATGLVCTSGDIAQAGLQAIAPVPQTLHRLLGWSPASGRFARHENDPLPHRVVVVDEASMVDLGIMDRLMRALVDDAQLVLLGDADQLPSIEAGAVFRDLCAALRAVRLSKNLRVGRDPGAQRIVTAAHAVNSGELDARFTASVTTCHSVDELSFEGVEHLAAPWAEVGEELLARWWFTRVAALEDFARRIARTYRSQGGTFDDVDRAELLALLDHHARARLLCATRVRSLATSADALNERLLVRLGALASQGWRHPSSAFAQGAPVIVERNDYERQLFNGDQGVIVRVDSGGADGPELMAVFRHADGLRAFPADALARLAPCLAMTVHKAQGSEFDDVVLVLPDVDLPLLTRELIYTAMTRARRSVLFVGRAELLGRAVARVVQRHSGVAEKLAVARR
jgi:exodeoxyribonuclease V alpha subunit